MEKQLWFLIFAFMAMVFSNLFLKKGKNEIRNISTPVAETVKWFIAIIMATLAMILSLMAGMFDAISGDGLIPLMIIITIVSSVIITILIIFKTFYGWKKSHNSIYKTVSVIFYGSILISFFFYFLFANANFSYFSFQ